MKHYKPESNEYSEHHIIPNDSIQSMPNNFPINLFVFKLI